MEEEPKIKYYNESAKKSIYKYRLKNPTCQLETARKWRENNPEKAKMYQKEYYEKNREKLLAKRREKMVTKKGVSNDTDNNIQVV